MGRPVSFFGCLFGSTRRKMGQGGYYSGGDGGGEGTSSGQGWPGGHVGYPFAKGTTCAHGNLQSFSARCLKGQCSEEARLK